MVLANLRAAAAGGATILNHAAVVGIEDANGFATGVRAACSESGQSFHVRGRCVLNATGPWVEALRRLESPDAPRLLHLSKGIHVALPASRIPVRNLLMLDAQDGRRVFVMRRGEIVFVGTTDTSHPGRPEVWPEICEADVRYLLEPLSRYLTAA